MDLKTLNTIGEAKESLICLRYTKTLNEEALREPRWIECKSLYDQANNNTQKAIVSIYNALHYHNRQIICMTRDLTMKLIREDKNHVSFGIRNDRWTEILSALFTANILKLISQEKSKPWIVEVVDSDLLKHMKGRSREELLNECFSFIKRQGKSGDGLGDGLGDGVRSTNVPRSTIGTALETVPLLVSEQQSIVTRHDAPLPRVGSKEYRDLVEKRTAEERRKRDNPLS